MRPSQALALRRNEVLALTAKSKTRNVRVFGSARNGKDQEGSDLDLIVDPLPGATLFYLGGLQVALEELLGVRVDLLTPGDLPSAFRERVLKDAVPV